MEVNDGKGLWDKYGMIVELRKRLDAVADTNGIARCGLIWSMSEMLNILKDGLKKDDVANAQKVEVLKAQIQAMEERTK